MAKADAGRLVEPRAGERSIADLRQERQELERRIANELRAFEDTFNVTVARVTLSQTTSNFRGSMLEGVSIEVEV